MAKWLCEILYLMRFLKECWKTFLLKTTERRHLNITNLLCQLLEGDKSSTILNSKQRTFHQESELLGWHNGNFQSCDHAEWRAQCHSCHQPTRWPSVMKPKVNYCKTSNSNNRTTSMTLYWSQYTINKIISVSAG